MQQNISYSTGLIPKFVAAQIGRILFIIVDVLDDPGEGKPLKTGGGVKDIDTYFRLKVNTPVLGGAL